MGHLLDGLAVVGETEHPAVRLLKHLFGVRVNPFFANVSRIAFGMRLLLWHFAFNNTGLVVAYAQHRTQSRIGIPDPNSQVLTKACEE